MWKAGFAVVQSAIRMRFRVDNAEFSYKVWVGFDDTNLYVGVRVSDNTPNNPNAAAESANEKTWMDDSVEVFVDGDNSNFATTRHNRNKQRSRRHWRAICYYP